MTHQDGGSGSYDRHPSCAGSGRFLLLLLPLKNERACHPERRRREEPALSAAKGSAPARPLTARGGSATPGPTRLPSLGKFRSALPFPQRTRAACRSATRRPCVLSRG